MKTIKINSEWEVHFAPKDTFLQSSIDAAHISYENCYRYQEKKKQYI